MTHSRSTPSVVRLRVIVRGAVQGVGFRPAIYRLAHAIGLNGWIRNNAEGVVIEVEGSQSQCADFLVRIAAEKPPPAIIHGLEPTYLDPAGYDAFVIRESGGGAKTALVLPDIATCDDCLDDISDPDNRRYRYPFTNCTNCGPRYTIINRLPYDRPNTSMASFRMCPACRREYEDPTDRRFHAQPNACPVCGPQISLLNAKGKTISEKDAALRELEERLLSGQVAAVKGLGGYHLLVDAGNEDAVAALRERKGREAKPLALMFPSVEQVEALCHVSPLESRLLHAPEAPIVLLGRREESKGPVASNPLLAPDNPYLGIMLPYTPLHRLLLADLDRPLVATSGNLSDEPICITEEEALERLGGIADVYLAHNRPIVRHVDDSIIRVVLDQELVMRRARGFAPLPVSLRTTDDASDACVLGVGAHLKNSVALTLGKNVFVSQHIGDLETASAYDTFRRVATSLAGLYDAEPGMVACDLHPDYLSSRYAAQLSLPRVQVQHHYAHVLACMAENELTGRVLGVSWDGTGFGPDGTIWGGEFLDASYATYERVGHLRTFMLPGGEQAVKEPRRSAMGMLFETFGEDACEMDEIEAVSAFTSDERPVVRQMLTRRINAPSTSSAGRLFDGIASILGIRQRSRYEGEAAMQLEFLAASSFSDEPYPYEVIEDMGNGGSTAVVDWTPLVRELIEDLRHSQAVARMAYRFHLTLAKMIVSTARIANRDRVVLTGGCFQNRLLTELTVGHLTSEGVKVYRQQRIPPNDGGISLGQAVHALHLSDNRFSGSDKT